LDKALQLYNESINQNLKDSKAWLGKAEALNLLGKFNESLIAYDKVLEIDSKSPDALSGKGLILFQMGRYKRISGSFGQSPPDKPQGL